jgi:hypothetical protein
MQKSLGYAPLLRRALRAIGLADVRSGILPPQSGFRRNDEKMDRSDFLKGHDIFSDLLADFNLRRRLRRRATADFTR